MVEHWFGRALPASISDGIGFRAIIDREGYLDFVYNRKSFRGTLPDDFKVWLDTIAIPALRAYVKQHYGDLLSAHDATGVYTRYSDDNRFKLEASSNQSCGYLYIAAWVGEVPAEQGQPA